MTEIGIAILIVGLLLLILAILFIFTVKRVNTLVKKFFIDKLQEYDFLIEDKEKKIEELNKEIDTKRSEQDELEIKIGKLQAKKDEYLEEKNEVVMPGGGDFQDEKMLERYKKIKQGFAFNYETKIKEFLASDHITYDENYQKYVCVRKGLTHKIIYKISTYSPEEQKLIINDILKEDAKELLKDLLNVRRFNIINFITKLDELITNSNPKIYIYVSNQNMNFNHLSKNIETVYDEKLTEGFRIEYKGKIYDYSI